LRFEWIPKKDEKIDLAVGYLGTDLLIASQLLIPVKLTSGPA
jgi:hypothetical protein